MDTSERIVEAYFRYVNCYATIPNIKCGGQKEIDILAMRLQDHHRMHIEISISTASSFSKLKADKTYDPELAKQRTEKPKQRRLVTYFEVEKFNNENVINKLKEYGFEKGNYQKVIVSWGWTPEAKTQADELNIELCDFRDLIIGLRDKMLKEKSFLHDDTLRTINLLVLADKDIKKSSS